MRITITIVLSVLLQLCYAQEKPVIMECSIYSLKDTVGVNFSNDLEINRWIWYKRNYNENGFLIEEISYPLPHNPSYKTTKITRTEQHGDTTITTILNGNLEIASQTKCYSKNKIRKCVTYNYASLTSSKFEKLNPFYILITIQDSIRNESKLTTISTDGINYDTVRSRIQPLVIERKQEPNKQVEFIKLDSVLHKTFSSSGYLSRTNDDTLCISYTFEYVYDVNKKMKEIIYLDFENIFKRKTVYIYENDLNISETNYRLTSDGWEVSNRTSREYNQYGDLKFKISDDYRNGKFSYRFVTYFEYKYYQ